jgi:crossover junction endodeoxyribonuclease RuvC
MAERVIILGIDPGLTRTGYGLVLYQASGLELVHYGTIAPPRRLTLAERLAVLYDELKRAAVEWKPDEVAVEEPFVAANVRSAMAIGQARAVALLVAAHLGLPVFQYAPTAVKTAISGYGHGDKAQVQEAVRLQLGLRAAPHPADAADALAIAICHAAHRRHAALAASP